MNTIYYSKFISFVLLPRTTRRRRRRRYNSRGSWVSREQHVNYISLGLRFTLEIRLLRNRVRSSRFSKLESNTIVFCPIYSVCIYTL